MAVSTVKTLQTLLDIAAQQCGQADSLFDVAAANNMGITDELVAGQTVNSPAPVVTTVAAWFSTYDVFPASGVSNAELTLLGGIDYMAIEFDFIVS